LLGVAHAEQNCEQDSEAHGTIDANREQHRSWDNPLSILTLFGNMICAINTYAQLDFLLM
jgi:hypothetical protein